MKQRVAHWCRIAASLSAIGLLLAACATDHEPPPIGAYTENDQPSVYPVEVTADELKFTVVSPTQEAADISASVLLDDLRPVLYYRYDVQSRINGNYVLMADPPKIFTVRKAPFYRSEPATVRIHFNLHNTSDQVLRMTQAVWALDMNGATVASAPLHVSDLLPGHSADVSVDGPALDDFKAAATGTLTVWLYGIGSSGMDHGMHWDVDYSYSHSDRQATGEIVFTTTSKQEAAGYSGREERAEPAASGDGP